MQKDFKNSLNTTVGPKILSGGGRDSIIETVRDMPIWHGFCAQPSSVTTIVTEERREGIASFRILAFGDTSHLYVHDEEPSFAARFCECYSDETRHD